MNLGIASPVKATSWWMWFAALALGGSALATPAWALASTTACVPVPPDAALGSDLALADDEVLDRAWRCTDLDGEHLLTTSRLRHPGQRGIEVQFTLRTRQNKGWHKDWQARDFVLGPLSSEAGARNQVLVKDADADGRIEVYISYVLPGPSQAVDEGKLLVFTHGRKYAIRGAIPRSPDDFGSRQIGSAFYDLPSPIQNQALSLWDRLSQRSAVQPVNSTPR